MASVFNVAINNMMQRGQLEELMRCHRSFRPIRSHHRTLAKQRPWLCYSGLLGQHSKGEHSQSNNNILFKLRQADTRTSRSFSLQRPCLFMVSAKPTFSTEVLMQLMSDNPLPVYLNYRSPSLSLALLDRRSKKHRMWSTCLTNKYIYNFRSCGPHCRTDFRVHIVIAPGLRQGLYWARDPAGMGGRFATQHLQSH